MESQTLIAAVAQYFSTEIRKGLSLRAVYVALQMADFLMTRSAIAAGFHEINPVVRGMLDAPAQLIIFKLVVPLAIVCLVPARFLLPAIGLLLVVIGINVRELFLPVF
jgi:hypothetical protein